VLLGALPQFPCVFTINDSRGESSSSARPSAASSACPGRCRTAPGCKREGRAARAFSLRAQDWRDPSAVRFRSAAAWVALQGPSSRTWVWGPVPHPDCPDAVVLPPAHSLMRGSATAVLRCGVLEMLPSGTVCQSSLFVGSNQRIGQKQSDNHICHVLYFHKQEVS